MAKKNYSETEKRAYYVALGYSAGRNNLDVKTGADDKIINSWNNGISRALAASFSPKKTIDIRSRQKKRKHKK